MTETMEVKLNVPNIPFVSNEELERDYWQCKFTYTEDKPQKLLGLIPYTIKVKKVMYIPYEYPTHQTFRIFRPSSTKNDRRWWWHMHHTGVDDRWNLWHDSFKRSIFHVPFVIFNKFFRGRIGI